MVLVAAAGPAMNIALAVVAALTFHIVGYLPATSALKIAGLLRPRWKAATRSMNAAGDPLSRKPIIGVADCCVRAASGRAAAAGNRHPDHTIE